MKDTKEVKFFKSKNGAEFLSDILIAELCVSKVLYVLSQMIVYSFEFPCRKINCIPKLYI